MGAQRAVSRAVTAAAATAFVGAVMLVCALPLHAARPADMPLAAPVPQPAVRPATKAVPTQPVTSKVTIDAPSAEADRLRRLGTVKTWGYQLAEATIEAMAASPFDLIVIDPNTGFGDKSLARADIDRLKRKPDGGRRIVIGYLSIGEAEDYRPDYFSKEYMEEDAPDWLLHENPDWRGNRLVNVCADGWQQTILGDERGRSLYDSIQPSPLHRLIELGLDGVYLDRVDVYMDIKKQCPEGEMRMVDFVVRLAAHARRTNPQFMVVQQNAEDLLKHARLVKAIDAVAKESLFFGWGGGEASNSIPVNSADGVRWSVERLNKARAAGRSILTVDYTVDKSNMASALKRSRDNGYIPYIAPKALNELWLPGKQF